MPLNQIVSRDTYCYYDITTGSEFLNQNLNQVGNPYYPTEIGNTGSARVSYVQAFPRGPTSSRALQCPSGTIMVAVLLLSIV